MGRARGECRGRRARRDRVGDRPRALHRARPHQREPGRARWPRALGHAWRGARSHPEPAPARPHRPRRPRAPRVHDRRGGHASRCARTGGEVRRSGGGHPHVRARQHADADAPAPPGHLDGRGAVVRAPRLARPVDRRRAARPGRGAGGQCAGPVGAVVARRLGRPADPGRLRCARGRHRAGAPGAARAGVLAAEGPERRCRDPQRSPGQLPGRDARAVAGRAREGPVGGVEAPARRRVPVPRRWHPGPGAHRAAGGGARGAERRARRAWPTSSGCPTPNPHGRTRWGFARLRRRRRGPRRARTSNIPRSRTRTASAASAPTGAST